MSKVNPIPSGYHSLTPNLICRDAEKAIEFYKQAFGAQERDRSIHNGKILHAELKIGDSILMLGEEMPEMGAKSPLTLGGAGSSIYLYVDDVDKTFEQAVNAGAQSVMPVTDMFWGDRFGKLSDPFGHQWGIATHKEELSEQEISKRQEEFFKAVANR